MPTTDDVADSMYEAGHTGRAWPLPSEALPELDTAGAYAVQRRLVERLAAAEPIAGYKAGATAAPAQQAFGLDGPFSGVLFHSGERGNATTVRSGDFKRLMLETELCFRLGTAITEPCDATGVISHVDTVCCAVELADAGGYGDQRFTGLDLVAGNGASAGYILAPQPDWRTRILDEVTVRFSRNGESLHDASAGDLIGGQWHALAWLVNQILALGYSVEPGHLLLTGSLGPPHPAAPGSYEANFGTFGQIAFELL